ncbi:MFS general substrate transporter [Obelidium mucronatum]|nr:MFS general substrate transporter [Obelidium mucronatum]
MTWKTSDTVVGDNSKKGDDQVESAPVVEGYDSALDFTDEEESKVLRQIDLRLMPWILFSTFILNMDRTNLSNAISGRLPATLGFTNVVVNNAGSMYSVIFAFAAFFGGILGKRYGPHRFIPFLVLSWGIVTLGHAFIENAAQFYMIRALVAITEGGVIPATIVYLGSFYKRGEIATRLSWFWGVQSLASAFSGIMASGLLQLEGNAGMYGWRWLFLVDGIITVIAAALFWFALPKSPYYTKGGLNFGGWLDDRQAAIAVTRVIRDDPLKLNYDSPVQVSDVWDTVKDYKVWGHLSITFIGLAFNPPYSTYLPSIISSFGYNVYASNALTAINYTLGFIGMTAMTTHSDKKGERGYHAVFSVIWLIVGFTLLEFLPDSAPKGVFYFATLFVSAGPSTHPLNVAWITENTGTIGKRTVASGLVISAANLYAIYASQIYQPSDAPRYHLGNFIILGFLAVSLLLFLNQKFLYVRLNRQRAAVWNAMSEEEKLDYNATTKHVGSDRLDFIFKT